MSRPRACAASTLTMLLASCLVAAELARLGHLAPSGKPYKAMSVKRMLER